MGESCAKNTRLSVQLLVGGDSMKTYLILLRRVPVPRAETVFQLDAVSLASITRITTVRIVKVYEFPYGVFDAAVVCRASDNLTIARMLNLFYGWSSTSLLVGRHGSKPYIAVPTERRDVLRLSQG
jgi:hypothetical protein